MMLASGDYRYDVFGIADLMVEHLRRSRVDIYWTLFALPDILSNFAEGR